MSRYFAFLFVEDAKVSALLNAAILVLNPRAKWPAHVTVSGPFVSPKNLPRKTAYFRTMLIMGAGQFRSATQNTVFLKAGTYDLRRISRKPDFGFNPHLTLYDGSDHRLGDGLHTKLKSNIPLTRLHVSRLHLVKTGERQTSMDLMLEKVDAEFFNEFNLTASTLDNLATEERIDIAAAAVNRAIDVARPRTINVVSSLSGKAPEERWQVKR